MAHRTPYGTTAPGACCCGCDDPAVACATHATPTSGPLPTHSSARNSCMLREQSTLRTTCSDSICAVTAPTLMSSTVRMLPTLRKTCLDTIRTTGTHTLPTLRKTCPDAICAILGHMPPILCRTLPDTVSAIAAPSPPQAGTHATYYTHNVLRHHPHNCGAFAHLWRGTHASYSAQNVLKHHPRSCGALATL